MPVTMLANGISGTVAVYTGTDDLPFTNPLTNLSRVKFHSDLDYPQIITERTVTVTFPRRTRTLGAREYCDDAEVTDTHVLFAHGRPGRPWVLASVLIDGVQVPMTGSVPVQQGEFPPSASIPCPWVRWVTIGTDGNNVAAFEYTIIDRDGTTEETATTMPAVSRTFTIWVTDENLG